MNKYYTCFILLLVTFLSYAQGDISKYLEPVPEMNGKVVFKETISPNKEITNEQLYELLNVWAKENYNSSDEILNNRILLSNAEDKNIACWGEKMLVFQKSALSLDQAKMVYQLILEVMDGKFKVTIRNIKYEYADSKNLIPAEEQITDKVALNKSKDKLNRYYDKFRIHTIDEVASIFWSINVYLNGEDKSKVAVGAVEQLNTLDQRTTVTNSQPMMEIVPVATPVPAMQTADETTVVAQDLLPSPLSGYRQIAADKIPGNIIKLLSDAMLITSGTSENVNVMTASWGGIGRFWEMPVALCFLNPTRYSVQTMDKGDTYTLSFYTEAYRDAVMYCGSVSGRDTDKVKGSGLTPIKTPSGASAFAEAWMIIECRKILVQPISETAVIDKNISKQWSKDGYHKIYMGEIINVWVK